MHEIILKDNNTNHKIFVDNLPINDLVPKKLIDILVGVIANDVIEILKSKQKRRNYYLKSKEKNCI